MKIIELLTERKKRSKRKKQPLRYYGFGGYYSTDTESDGGGIEENTDSKYLTGTEKVEKISPVLKGKYGKKQTKLMNKFFGSS